MNSGHRLIREIAQRQSTCALSIVTSGTMDKSLAEARETVSLDPNALSYTNLVGSYLLLNRLEEARATADEALAKRFDSLHANYYEIAFLQHDAAAMAQQVAWSTGKTGVEDQLLGLKLTLPPIPDDLGKHRSSPSKRRILPNGQR